ncbi:hypothetical protein F4778DRAFT_244745 [Xylariomycetidae sp. FL2044]|nr:hypothetical protein F4778DRAFT_244745 [Xylariomycetidae sp. FL2044]
MPCDRDVSRLQQNPNASGIPFVFCESHFSFQLRYSLLSLYKYLPIFHSSMDLVLQNSSSPSETDDPREEPLSPVSLVFQDTPSPSDTYDTPATSATMSDTESAATMSGTESVATMSGTESIDPLSPVVEETESEAEPFNTPEPMPDALLDRLQRRTKVDWAYTPAPRFIYSEPSSSLLPRNIRLGVPGRLGSEAVFSFH